MRPTNHSPSCGRRPHAHAQGAEREVIVLSTAVTRPGAFAADACRLNVALTRARCNLLVVGCAPALQQSAPAFAAILRKCRGTPGAYSPQGRLPAPQAGAAAAAVGPRLAGAVPAVRTGAGQGGREGDGDCEEEWEAVEEEAAAAAPARSLAVLAGPMAAAAQQQQQQQQEQGDGELQACGAPMEQEAQQVVPEAEMEAAAAVAAERGAAGALLAVMGGAASSEVLGAWSDAEELGAVGSEGEECPSFCLT